MNRTKSWSRVIAIAIFTATATPLSALAAVSGSATYASQQNGIAYDYNLLLNNTGDTALHTFWFSWMPGDSFLPSVPDSAAAPAGWTAQIVQDYYGTSILWNTTGAGLAPGAALTGFAFTSVDSPDVLQGNDPYFGYYRVTTSYVYASTVNANDYPFPTQFGVFLAAPGPVPEPASAGLLACAASVVTLRRRRRK
jgi:hypothetical protein